jgi:hypothetical protein
MNNTEVPLLWTSSSDVIESPHPTPPKKQNIFLQTYWQSNHSRQHVYQALTIFNFEKCNMFKAPFPEQLICPL